MHLVCDFTSAVGGLLEVAPEHIAIAQEIYQQYLSSNSLRGIADFPFGKNLLSPTGKGKWSKSALDSMLTKNKYINHIISFEDYFTVKDVYWSITHPSERCCLALFQQGETQQVYLTQRALFLEE